MRDRDNLIITGFMGTGKTSVGQEIARRLGREFVDMDALIEAREGMTVADIFAQRGEVHFRRCGHSSTGVRVHYRNCPSPNNPVQ